MGATAGVIVIAMLIPLAWLAADRESGQGSARPSLPAADASPSASTGPAVIALLGERTIAGRGFEAHYPNRLLRISLPGGEVQRERTLGRRLPNRATGKRDSFRLNVAAGPLLAVAPDNKAVVALVREPAPSRDTAAVIDAASLKTRCSYPLEKGVRYSGLLLGRSGTLYAFGNERAGGSRRWDAVLTIVDMQTGAVVARQTLRKAEHGKWRGWGTDWFVYGGFCGEPFAVHRDRFLVLAATPVDKRGYPAGHPRLRLIDLRHPGSGARVRRSGAPLDALVVRSQG